MNEQNLSLLKEDLVSKGWHASDHLLPHTLAEELWQQLQEHHQTGKLTPALIGHHNTHQHRTKIRGDHTYWLEPGAPLPREKNFYAWLEALKTFLNRELLLGVQSEEFHYALYPPQTGYLKHRDVFADSSDRVISVVVYLNKDWQPEWGGQLAIYEEQDPETLEAKIDPLFARCVVFLSDKIHHEVIFTNKERISVTGWLKKTASEAVFRAF